MQNYNYTAIRKLVEAAFDDEDLQIFCYDRFSNVAEQFTTGQTKRASVQMLIDHVRRHGLTDRLLGEIRAANSYQYGKFEQGLKEDVSLSPSYRTGVQAATSFEMKTKLVDALLSCACMSDRDSRNTVVNKLRPDIKSSIRRNNADHIDVVNIVSRCLDFPGGISELVGIVRVFEGGSVGMQNVDRVTIPEYQRELYGKTWDIHEEKEYDTDELIFRSIPKELRTVFKQYLLFFNEYIRITAGKDINLDLISLDDGRLLIDIQAADGYDPDEIHRYLNKYMGFIKENVDKIHVDIETNISHREQKFFEAELKNEINRLRVRLEMANLEIERLTHREKKFFEAELKNEIDRPQVRSEYQRKKYGSRDIYDQSEKCDKTEYNVGELIIYRSIPKELRTAFKQYLIYFNDYILKVAGKHINLDVISIDDGLIIEIKAADPDEIYSYLIKYVGFLKENIDNLHVDIETNISHKEKKFFEAELKNEINRLQLRLEIANLKREHLIDISKKNQPPIIINQKQLNHDKLQINTGVVKVFIGCSEKDMLIANQIYTDIQKQGITPWMAHKDINTGEKTDTAIRNALKESNYFLALLSTSSVTERGILYKELKQAFDILAEFLHEDDIFIIPVRLDDCNPNDEILKELHVIDLHKTSYSNGLEKIIQALQLPRQKKLEEKLKRISEISHTIQNLEELYPNIHSIVIEFMPAKNFRVALYNSAKKIFEVPFFIDEHDSVSIDKYMKMGLTGYVFRTKQSQIITSEIRNELIETGEVELVGPPSKSWLGVPIKMDDKCIGIISVHSYDEEGIYGEAEKEFLEIVSEQLAIAIKRFQIEPDKPNTMLYNVLLGISSDNTLVGGDVEAIIYLTQPQDTENDTYLLEILQTETISNDLNIILTAPGLHFESDNVASLPFEIIDLQALSQTASFRLTALYPGTTTIKADLYLGEIFLKTLKKTVEVFDTDDSSLLRKSISVQPRPVSQPDIMLQVRFEYPADALTCKLHYHLKSFRYPLPFSSGAKYPPHTLSMNQTAHIQSLLDNALQDITGGIAEDGYQRLVSLGQYLFQHVFPTDLQNDILHMPHFVRTMLIQADPGTFPLWELIHDGQHFLSERFIIGRWLPELDKARSYEFPIGLVNIAYYSGVEQPEEWAGLIKPRGAPMPFVLPDGVMAELSLAESVRGLHLLRSGNPAGTSLHDAPVHIKDSGRTDETGHDIRPAKLSLKRNRSLVTLGYTSAGFPEQTELEQTWAIPFLRARCSAFAGPLWAVQPATEAAFVSSFYRRLWAGDSLGQAFQSARNFARVAVPESPDWLAYVLFGDPMARPYLPVKGEGYAAVEAIGRDMDDPILPDTSARFRVSLRRTPPVWHEERVIEVTETLDFENLRVHVKCFDIQVLPSEPVEMTQTPAGDYIGWFTLIAPKEIAGETTDIQVFFTEGKKVIHSLAFPLYIGTAESREI
ncbi:MAG: TIR domain-containing protein [Desulfobacterales bacterium]|nr:TIR domain-containing protein [Desulfobacterales bacterium]